MKKQDDVNTELKIIEEKINAISLVIYEFNVTLQTEIDAIVNELNELKDSIKQNDSIQ